MRKAYRILADIIAIGVAVQAMVMVFGVAGLFLWINDQGGSVDAAVVDWWEDDHPTFQGAIGVPLHQMIGTFVIPLVALALLVVAFFAAVDGGMKWAAIIVVSVIVQVAAGISAGDAPWIGLVHGLNAFVLFSAAIVAARAARPDTQTAVAVTP
jgi:uncharacterized membrane protein